MHSLIQSGAKYLRRHKKVVFLSLHRSEYADYT